MLQVEWSTDAHLDLIRLYEFLRDVDLDLARRVANALGSAPEKLVQNPRIGEKLAEIESGEVRRLLIGHYEVRYEITEKVIYILRIFHCRENR